MESCQIYRLVRYRSRWKGKEETAVGAFRVIVDVNRQPLMAFPVNLTGRNESEVQRFLAMLWADCQYQTLEFPDLVDLDAAQSNEDAPLVWREPAPAP